MTRSGLSRRSAGVQALARRVGFACALAFAACGTVPAQPVAETPAAPIPLDALAGSRWTWLSAQCVDGGIALDALGFERTLDSEVRGNRVILTYDTVFSEPSCVTTEVWSLSPVPGNQWWFSPEARVTQPVRAKCGASENTPRPCAIMVRWS